MASTLLPALKAKNENEHNDKKQEKTEGSREHQREATTDPLGNILL
jgi:hypothetical protein